MLQAHPGARHDRVELLDDGSLRVWVRARPVEGQANAAIERAVATALGLRPRKVALTAGLSGHRKTVELDLPDLGAVRERLLAHGLRPS